MSDSWIGSTIGNGRYKITSKLGEGGMGSVYCAWDSNLQTDVVVKVPLATRDQDPEATARFVREASSLVKLSHPHVVKIIDFGQQGGQPYAVMQFLSGGSLATRQDGAQNRIGHRRQSPESLKDWLPSIAKALDFVHSQGYLHRDVKPANILFDAHGNAFLSDFGITKFAVAAQAANSGKSLTGAGMVVGTPEYMAPEIILGQSADGRLDQYALAVMVFEQLAGRRPFEDATPTAVLVQHTTTPPPDIRSFNTDILPALSTVIRQALSKSPAERFATCIAFAEALESAASGKSQAVRLKCPACQKSLKLEWKVRGRRLPCPGCGAELKVAEDLTALTLPTGSGSPRETKGGTRAVFAGDVRSRPESEQATDPSEQSPDQHHPDDFWNADLTDAEAPAEAKTTVAITAGEVPTRRTNVKQSTVKQATQQTSKPGPPPAPVSGISRRTAILIGAGVVAISMIAILAVVLVTRGGKNATKDLGTPELASIASKTPVMPESLKPEIAAAEKRTNSPQSVAGLSKPPSEQASAVYDVEINPPDAQLSVDPSLASISGVGSRRRVVVPHPTLNTSITLVATADGFQELRREVNLRPGGAETIALKLESIPGSSKSLLDNRKALPGSGTTTPPDSTDRTQAQGAIGWKLVSTIGNSGSDIYSLALNHEGSRVAAGGADRTLQVWDARTGALKARVERPSEVGSVAYFKDSKRLMCSVGRERRVEVWKESALSLQHTSVAARRRGSKPNSSTSSQPWIQFTNDPNQELWRAVLSTDERLVATGGNSGIVTIWEVATTNPLRQVLHGLGENASPEQPSPQPPRGASGRFGRRPSGRSARPQPLSSAKPGAAILSLAFSPDGKQLACGGESGVIALCNVVTGQAQAKLEGHSSSILQLAYSRDGQHLASLGSDRTLRLWDIKQQKESQTFDTGVGGAMAVSPAGRWIAVAGDDNSIRIWDVENPKDFSVLDHGVNVTHLVFSAQGARIATADRDRTIRVWDLHFVKPPQSDSTSGTLAATTAIPTLKQSVGAADSGGPFAGKQAGQRLDNGLGMGFVWIPPGEFKMGSAIGPDHQKNEPQVDVKLSGGFWLGKCELTRAQWQLVMKTTPWKELTDDLNPVSGDNYPVTHVTWQNAIDFCRKLTEEEHRAGRLPPGWEFDLPTEAQWEYACRAGTTTPYYCGNTFDRLKDSAWFKGNIQNEIDRHAQLVGSREPNQWGLYDMHGNVSEWCRDWYASDPPGGLDPEVSSGSGRRVIRGGNWRSTAENVRSAYRIGANLETRNSAVGFRVAAVPVRK